MDLALVTELTFILGAGLFGGLIAFRLNQPVVIGYILAGLVLGSIFPRFSGGAHGGLTGTIAEIGVALLLFTIGLEFSLDRIKRVGRPAVMGASLQIISVLALFAVILNIIFGVPLSQAIFLGGIASLSSTAVVAKLLDERGETESSHGELMMAWLIVQDLAVVPLMLILPVVSNLGNLDIMPLAISIGKSALAIYLVFLLGKKTVPYLFKKLALFNNRELLLVSAFLFCIGLATLAKVIGLSFAVGAFLAGVLISTSAVNHEVFTEIRPLRDLFSSVFFVSLGFLITFSTLLTNLVPALTLVVLALVFKLLIILVLILVFNYHSKLAFYSSLGLFQIGEFSFLLAKVGLDRGIITDQIYQTVIAASIITIILTPFIYGKSTQIYKWFRDFLRENVYGLYQIIYELLDSDAKMPKPRSLNVNDHIVIVGYGRVGNYIGQVFELADIQYVVVDLHYRTIENLRKKGIHSVYGDAVNKDVLKLAKISKAKGVIIATPDFVTNELILDNVRDLNPSAEVIVRAHREEDIAKLHIRGVRNVIEPEFEASMQIGKKILNFFSHTSDEIGELVKKVRDEKKY